MLSRKYSSGKLYVPSLWFKLPRRWTHHKNLLMCHISSSHWPMMVWCKGCCSALRGKRRLQPSKEHLSWGSMAALVNTRNCQRSRKRCDLTEQTNTKYFRIKWNVLTNVFFDIAQKIPQNKNWKGHENKKGKKKNLLEPVFSIEKWKPNSVFSPAACNFALHSKSPFCWGPEGTSRPDPPLAVPPGLSDPAHGPGQHVSPPGPSLPAPVNTAACTMPTSGPVPRVGPLAPCCGLVSSPGPGPGPISFSSWLNLLDVAWLWLTPSPCQGLPTDPDTPGCGWQHPLVRAQQVQSPQAGASALCHVTSSSVMAGRAPASMQGTSTLTCAVINRGK